MLVWIYAEILAAGRVGDHAATLSITALLLAPVPWVRAFLSPPRRILRSTWQSGTGGMRSCPTAPVLNSTGHFTERTSQLRSYTLWSRALQSAGSVL